MAVDDPKKIGKRVRGLRGERSQREIADRAGLHVKGLAKIEKGQFKRAPRMDTLERLARALGVPVERLAGKAAPLFDVRPMLDDLAKDPDLLLLLGGKPPTDDERGYLAEVEFAQYRERVPLTPRRLALSLVGLRGEPEFVAELRTWRVAKNGERK